MRHFVLIMLLLPCIAGCSSGNGSSEPAGWDRIAKVLSTVPSDALCVTYAENSRSASEILDSASIFLDLGIEKLRTGMAVSECFNGTTVKVLTLAPIKNREFADSSSNLHRVMDSARSRHLLSEFIPDAPALGQGEGVLILTQSGPQLRVAARHIDEGRSILDADNFKLAAFAAQGAPRMTILRNSGARRLLDKEFLGGAFPVRSSAEFLHDAAQWTTFIPGHGGEMTIIPVPYSTGICYFQMLQSLPTGRSRLGNILPEGTEVAISLSISPEFRNAYETYLDAGVKLTQYRRRLAVLEETSGKDPLKWEKEQDIREVALVTLGADRVVMVRPAKRTEDSECTDNPYRGFIPALYGSAFRIPDDSAVASRHGWYVIGSRSSVETLTEDSLTENRIGWPSKSCHFIIFNSGRYTAWDKTGIKTWNSNQ